MVGGFASRKTNEWGKHLHVSHGIIMRLHIVRKDLHTGYWWNGSTFLIMSRYFIQYLSRWIIRLSCNSNFVWRFLKMYNFSCVVSHESTTNWRIVPMPSALHSNCFNHRTLGTSNQAIYYNLLNIYFSLLIDALLYEFCFLWFTNCVFLSDDNSLIPGWLWLLAFVFCFKQQFDTRYLVFYNPSPPRTFLSLDLFSEYRIQHGAIGPLYVTSSYSTWIFCRGVSGFATDCPCDVWCRGLTTCLLHVGPPFGNRVLNTSWAVGLTYWIVYLHFFCILTYEIIYVLIHHIIFWLYLYFLNIIIYFFKYSCTNIIHRRSLCTFYSNSMTCCEGTHQSPMDSPNKESVMRNFISPVVDL